MSFHHQILMDLIRDHIDAVLLADIHNSSDLFFLPHSSHRIMRGTENEELNVLLFDLPLKIFIVYNIAVLPADQRALRHLAVIVYQGVFKWIVDRRHDQHMVLLFRQHLHQPVDCRNHSRGEPEPFLLHLIAMPGSFPADKGLPVFLRRVIISEHSEIHIFSQGFPDAGRRLKIHVRHPQWKQLFFAKLLPAGVPFFGVCMSPLLVTHFFHVCTSLLSCLFLFLQSSPEHLIFFLWKMQSDSIDFFPGAKVS